MIDIDPQMLWALLLVEGPERLAPGEADELALWLARQPPTARQELLPESAGEADHLAWLAAHLVEHGLAELAVAPARMALWGRERFAPADANAAMNARRALADALIRCLAADEAMPAEETLAMAQDYAQRALALWGGADFLAAEGQLLLGRAHEAAGEPAKALAPMMRSLAIAEAALGPEADWCVQARLAILDLYDRLKDEDGAIAFCRAALARLDEEAGEDSPALRPLWIALADRLPVWRDGPEIEAIQARLVGQSAVHYGPDSREQADDRVALARHRIRTGRPQEAIPDLLRARAILEAWPDSRALDASAAYWLAQAHTEIGADAATVETLYREAIQGYAEILGADAVPTLYARRALGDVLAAGERWEESAAILEAARAEAAARHGGDHPVTLEIGYALARLRREWLYAREDGYLWAWAMNELTERHGADRLGLIVAMLRLVAPVMRHPDDRDRLFAEAAILLARQGQIDAALALADAELGPPRQSWDGARAHAEAIAFLDEAGRPDEAEAHLARALDTARLVSVYEAGADQACSDLGQALSERLGRGTLDRLRPRLPADIQPTVDALSLEERIDNDDLDGALVLLDRTPADAIDPGTLLSLGELAARLQRAEVVDRVAPLLAAADLAHHAVDLLFFVGREEAALAQLATLSGNWARLEGLAMAAGHYGEKRDRDRFERWAQAALDQLAAHPEGHLFQPLKRIADGGIEAMAMMDFVEWAAARVPEAAETALVEALVRSLQYKERFAEARRVVEAVDADPDVRERLAADLDRAETTARLPNAILRAEEAGRAGHWEAARAALDELAKPNPFAAVHHLIRLAETAKRAGDENAAAQALKSALAVLPGNFADSAGKVFFKESLRFDCGRALGQAVARLLPLEWRQAFSQAALLRAARMTDLVAATPFVIAAGQALVDSPLVGEVGS
ncbi:MAG: hypothetical protein IT565_03370 [Rhodospirillales bacterium]|nr:hypothetical protein [Rhodospirillales bacterium]